MPDIFDKCATDGGYFGEFRVIKERFFTMPVLDDVPGPHMKINGDDFIMWSINNYIGLAQDEEIRQEALKTLERWSISSPMGSRMMSGTTQEHLNLEKSLADYSQKEDSFLFNYGYMGVLGVVTSLCGPDDTLIVDKLSHACIVDAAFSAKGTQNGKPIVRFFRHNDMNDLESVLKSANSNRIGGVMILTEGVYGMTGDLADLKGIVQLAKKYEARIFIDDAHGVGVLGKKGRGTADYLGVQDDIDVYFGTFAKAFASIGGFMSSSNMVRDWVAYNSRTQVFAKSMPMVYVKSLQMTLRKVMDGDDKRDVMWARSNLLKKGLEDLGCYIGPGHSPICAVFIPAGEHLDDHIKKVLIYLRQHGVFCTGVKYPVIPPGLVMLRMIPTSVHSEADVMRTIEVFRNMRDDLGLEFRPGKPEMDKLSRIYPNNLSRVRP